MGILRDRRSIVALMLWATLIPSAWAQDSQSFQSQQEQPSQSQTPQNQPQPGQPQQKDAPPSDSGQAPQNQPSQTQPSPNQPPQSQNPPDNPQPQNPPAQNQGQSQKPQQPQNPPDQNNPQQPQNPPDQGQSQKPADEQKDNGTANPAEAVKDATKQAATATLTKVRDWETQWLIGAYVSRNRKLVPLTIEEREDLYLRQTFLTPAPYLKSAFDAAIDQARGWPHQWDDGTLGYVERFGSREGQSIASNSFSALGNAKLGYEVRYDQCRCRGFWPRTRHAIIRNFLTYDRTESEMRPQWALYGGAFAGGMIATAWKPKPLNPFAQGGRAMLGQTWYGIALNFFTEFAVDINRKLGGK